MTTYSPRSTVELPVVATDSALRHVVDVAFVGLLALVAVVLGLALEVTSVAVLGGLGLVAAAVVLSNRWVSGDE